LVLKVEDLEMKLLHLIFYMNILPLKELKLKIYKFLVKSNLFNNKLLIHKITMLTNNNQLKNFHNNNNNNNRINNH
jgi:hypothetical protein